LNEFLNRLAVITHRPVSDFSHGAFFCSGLLQNLLWNLRPCPASDCLKSSAGISRGRGKTTLRRFDESCIAAVPAAMSAQQIKAIRERNHVSQPLFARYLNTSASTVKQWEAGDKHPSGMALKLLSIVHKHGLEILA